MSGPMQRYEEIIVEMRAKAHNAAMRNKPTMWTYYLDMVDGLTEWFADVSPCDGGYAGAALALSQMATRKCPTLPHREAARLWALSIYGRRILAAWGAGNGRPVSLEWLHQRASEAVPS